MPSPADPSSGCRFPTRCHRAQRICSRIEPAMTRLKAGRQVACHCFAVTPLFTIGCAWLVSVGLYFPLQYVRVLLTEGLAFEQRLFSLLNLWNILFAAIALSPGLVCVLTAHCLGSQRQ